MRHFRQAALAAALITMPAATAPAQDNSSAGMATTMNTTGATGTPTTTGNPGGLK